MTELNIDERYIKTYKTKANLLKALEGMPDELMYLVAWTESGRCTAVFTNSLKTKVPLNGLVMSKGFMIVG